MLLVTKIFELFSGFSEVKKLKKKFKLVSNSICLSSNYFGVEVKSP